jgi:zinc/manganese transport system substrate-binding protein
VKKLRKPFFIVLAIIAILITGCKNSRNVSSNAPSGKVIYSVGVGLDIMVTNKCLYTMVKSIAGENNNVDFMFKDESEQKNLKYTDDSILNVGKQDLFIYSGAGFEDWSDDFLSRVDKSKVGVTDVSRGVKTLTYQNKLDKNYGNKNPYYWMDADNYGTMLLNIKSAIEEKDPKNNVTYENNFNASIKEVNKYKTSLNDIASKMKQYTLVTDVDKFNYMTNSVNINSIKFYRNDEGAISPEDEQKISSEQSDNKKLCFIYQDDNDLNQNKDIIDKYHMKTIKLIVYDGNISYMNMLKQNIASLEGAEKSD